MRLGVVWLESHRPSNQVDGGVSAAGFPGEHTEKMQAIDVGGINRTDLPAKALGLSTPAGLVVRERRSEPLRNLHRRTGRSERAIRGSLTPASRGASLLSIHGEKPTLFAENAVRAGLLAAAGAMRVLVAPSPTTD